MEILWILSTLLLVCFGEEDFKLTILHTNDIHARIDEFDAAGSRCTPTAAKENHCYGGIARQKYMVESIRKSNPNTLFLNAGDYYQGTMWFYLMKEDIIADTIKFLNHDAMALGNHEFDEGSVGLQKLLRRINETGTPVIGCNVDFSENPLLKSYQPLPSIVLNRGGVDIGLIGYLTPDTTFLSNVDNGTILTDEIECIKREATKLHKRGVKIIIAVGHSGYLKDQQIAAEVPLVQMVVGGHSHTYLSSVHENQLDKPKGDYPTVVTRSDKTKALVVQDFWLGKYLGYINVTFDKMSGVVKHWQGSSPLLLDHSVAKDKDVENFLQGKREIVDQQSDVHIGTANYVLSGDKEICRYSECALGNLLADSVISYFVDHAESPEFNHIEPIDIAVVNGGGIRATLPKGNITFGDIVTVYPFANAIWVLPMTGEQVTKMYENGLRKYDPERLVSNGGFLHSSGVRLIVNPSKPPMQRVTSVKVWCWRCQNPDWKDIVPQNVYRVAMSAYVAQGGDNHNFTDIASNQISKLTISGLDAAKAHAKRYSPLHLTTDGRLQILT